MTSKKLNVMESVTPNLMNFNVSRPSKEVTKSKLEELIKEETRMVKGIFQCFETPGSTVKICVKKYSEKMGVPVFEKTMTDGVSYEIPLYVARHLNGVDVTAGALGDASTRNVHIGTCSYAVHGFKWNNGQPPGSILGDNGIPVPIVGVAKRVKRFGFQSMEFGGD